MWFLLIIVLIVGGIYFGMGWLTNLGIFLLIIPIAIVALVVIATLIGIFFIIWKGLKD